MPVVMHNQLLLLLRRVNLHRKLLPLHCVAASSAGKGYNTMEAVRPKAVVRIQPGEDNVTISLNLAGKSRNLNRPLSEPLEKPLARIRANVAAPQQHKKGKRQKQSGPAPPPPAPAAPPQEVVVALYTDEAAESGLIDPSSSNGEAWSLGRALRVGDVVFDVEYNPPTVSKISLPRTVMVGFPILPSFSLQHADEALCQWQWLKAQRGAASGPSSWEATGHTSPRYTPSAEDAGCLLSLRCTPAVHRTQPGAGSLAEEGTLWLGECASAETGPVTEVGIATAADIRHPHPPTPTESPSLRVLSYNILADQYAGSDYAQKVLFNYCPLQYLEPEYRRQLVLQELERYSADIICLQEVDEKAFNETLLPHLQCLGYDGRYTNKMGKVREGPATLFRTSRLQAVASTDILLRDLFRQPLPPPSAQFQPMLQASPALTFALQQVTTVAQATLLAPPAGAQEEEGAVLVLNTHLFFHPYAPHIRTMHTTAILQEAKCFLDSCMRDPRLSEQLGGRRASLLFCGDLNSDLNDGVPGVIELLRSGQLPGSFWDWEQGAAFSWGKGEEEELAAAAVAAGGVPPQPSKAAKSAPPDTSTASHTTNNADGCATTGTPAVDVPTDAAMAEVDAARSPSEAMHGCGADFSSADAEPSSRIAVTGIDVKVPFKLRSADDLKTPYTNYTSGYKALLDYVWYEEQHLEVTHQLPMPSEEALSTFIPSRVFPSDHLAVVYDLRWK